MALMLAMKFSLMSLMLMIMLKRCIAEHIINPGVPGSSQIVTCGINEDCYITCNESLSCYNTLFHVYNNTISIKCSGVESCKMAKIFSLNTQSLNIMFEGENSFEGGQLLSHPTDQQIEVNCNSNKACYDSRFYYNVQQSTNHTCTGPYACQATTIHSLSAISLYCNDNNISYSFPCHSSNIIWPIDLLKIQNSELKIRGDAAWYAHPLTIYALYGIKSDSIMCYDGCDLKDIWIMTDIQFDFKSESACEASNSACVESLPINNNDVNQNIFVIDTYHNSEYQTNLDFSSYIANDHVLLILSNIADTNNMTLIPPLMTNHLSWLSILCMDCDFINYPSTFNMNLGSVSNAAVTNVRSGGIWRAVIYGPTSQFIHNTANHESSISYHLENTSSVTFNSVRYSDIFLGDTINVQFDCSAHGVGCHDTNVYSSINPTTNKMFYSQWLIQCPSTSDCYRFNIHFTDINQSCTYLSDTSNTCDFMLQETTTITTTTLSSSIPPSESPSIYPTDSPSIIPSVSPTIILPSTSPSISSTVFPTLSPTKSSVLLTSSILPSESISPSIYPTDSSSIPSVSPTIEPTSKSDSTLTVINLELKQKYLRLALYCIIIFEIVIAFLSWIDSKCSCRRNDFFKISYLISALFQILDFESDIFFAVSVFQKYKVSNALRMEYLIISVLALAFIIIPIAVSMYQLFTVSTQWIDADNRMRSWYKRYNTFLFIFCAFTGSAFSAVSICNSNVFGLNIFCMGLSQQSLSLFSAKKIYSIILLENIPQLILIIWYFSLNNFSDLEYIPFIQMIFSLISIMVAFNSSTLQKRIYNQEDYLVITFDVTDPYNQSILKNLNVTQNRIKKIKVFVSSILGVNNKRIEAQRPRMICDGLCVNLYIAIAEKSISMKDQCNHFQKLLNLLNNIESLGMVVAQSWKLESIPYINKIKCEPVYLHNSIHVDNRENTPDTSIDVEANNNTNHLNIVEITPLSTEKIKESQWDRTISQLETAISLSCE